MKNDLTGKTAVVTGSTQGIGFAIAKGLSEAGATVVVNGRTEAKVAAAVQRLGGHARGITADLGTAEGCSMLVAAQQEADIVVHNLGVFTVSDFFDTPDTEWDRHWQVNVMAGVRLARAYLPGKRRNKWRTASHSMAFWLAEAAGANVIRGKSLGTLWAHNRCHTSQIVARTWKIKQPI